MADNPAREMFERGETITVSDDGAVFLQPYLNGQKVDNCVECSREHIKRYVEAPGGGVLVLGHGPVVEMLQGVVTIEESPTNG